MIHFASKHVLLQHVASSGRGSACVVGQYVTQLEQRFHQPIQRLQLLGVAMQAACPKSIRQCFVPRYHESAKEAHLHQYNNMLAHTHRHTFNRFNCSCLHECATLRNSCKSLCTLLVIYFKRYLQFFCIHFHNFVFLGTVSACCFACAQTIEPFLCPYKCKNFWRKWLNLFAFHLGRYWANCEQSIGEDDDEIDTFCGIFY